jgi:protease-4
MANLGLLKGYVEGRDVADIELVFQLIIARHYHFGIQNQLMACLSGIDMAAKDALGKQVGLPLCRLIGGRGQTRVPVYASGGYITAIAADHIIALETSLVGSIGVLFQYPNVSDLLKTLGIKVEEIKSSPLKAAPNGFEPTSPEARAAIEAIVSDSYAWFRSMVKARRHLDDAALERVADGRVFTGRQGIALKLVDEIGDERAALAWLAKEKNIDPKTPVRDYRLRERFSDWPFLHTATVATLDALGLSSWARRLEEWGALQAVERLNLDGLLALWHPPIAN